MSRMPELMSRTHESCHIQLTPPRIWIHHVTYTSVMSHTHIHTHTHTHTQIHQSCHIHTHISHVTYTQTHTHQSCHIHTHTHTHQSCHIHTHTWVMSHTHTHTHTWVMSHRPYTVSSSGSSTLVREWDMSHMSQSLHIWMSHVAYKSVMPHINKSCHARMSQVTSQRHLLIFRIFKTGVFAPDPHIHRYGILWFFNKDECLCV